ncbi:MAG TPA: hypothetical protein VIG51_12565 [Candidatus Baltobacteraceae bacterium]|jgi:hypothetical protein
MHNEDVENDPLESPAVKKHLSADLVALLRKTQNDEPVDENTLSIVADIVSAFAYSGLLEFVYLPNADDGGDDEVEPAALFAVEQVDLDVDRGSVLLLGDVTHVHNPPITLEGIEYDEDEDR